MFEKSSTLSPWRRRALATLLVVGFTGLAACTTPVEAPRPPVSPVLAKHTVHAVTASHELITFRAHEPQKILRRQPLSGLAAGEQVLGIDYRVARGVLYALGSSGRLYTVDTGTGRLTPVGAAPLGQPLPAARVGFDFNPAADRLRIVADTGLNWRAHPDTGALVDGNADLPGWQPDGALRYAPGDAQAGTSPRIVAAGYTYNKTDSKLTTNYAIDLAAQQLVVQGSIEGAVPVVSPNTGLLRSVGPLGVPGVVDASFDIADIDNTAVAALQTDRCRLYHVDLQTGRARLIGLVDAGGPLRGLAIEP